MWFLEIGGKGLEKLMVCKYEPLDMCLVTLLRANITLI